MANTASPIGRPDIHPQARRPSPHPAWEADAMQDSDPIRLPGPWTHRDINANGGRFHVAEMGEGPLVLFLHGFPEFWWSWRHQLPVVADAGFRAVAMDLRGYGGSDKTPRGYDPLTLTMDVTGVIRALGQSNATLVGHGWGAFLAWTAAVFRPAAVNRLAVTGSAHPRRLRQGLLTDPKQIAADRFLRAARRVDAIVHSAEEQPTLRFNNDSIVCLKSCRLPRLGLEGGLDIQQPRTPPGHGRRKEPGLDPVPGPLDDR